MTNRPATGNPNMASQSSDTSYLLTRVLLAVGTATLSSAHSLGLAAAEEGPFLTHPTPLVLLSANDAEVLRVIDPTWSGKELDSVTVIRLGPDHPPQLKTIYNKVPNTIAGPPHMAIAARGRFGFVTNHSLGLDMEPPDDAEDASARARGPNQLSVIDVESPDLKVVHRVELPPYPMMAVAHPDDKHVIVGGGSWFHVLSVEGEDIKLVSQQQVPIMVTGFDVSPAGDAILATGGRSAKPNANPFFVPDIAPHVLKLNGAAIEYVAPVALEAEGATFNGIFSPRFSPDGKWAIVLNGAGTASKGTLDDALLIDMTHEKPTVTSVIRQLGDGLESSAFHPNGKTLVVCCVDRTRGLVTSHLAVVNIASTPQLLYHLPIEPVPEGIEFTADGSKLFVGCTAADHIVVYDVADGVTLKRSPFVLRTGHCPSSLAISPCKAK